LAENHGWSVKEKPMRLFIAINFNDITRSKLVSLRDDLRSRSKKGNFTATENLHLTLVFLGECSTEQADIVRAVLSETTFDPFPISIERVGRFRRDGGDLWWAGVKASKPLQDLHSDLTDRLANAGFALEKRKYSPHITLGRKIATEIDPWNIPPFGEAVTGIDLMKSETVGGKLTYTAI
jgi:2'-5' RNA ligase